METQEPVPQNSEHIPITEDNLEEKEKEAAKFVESRQYSMAASLYSYILDFKVKLFGDMSLECADTFFKYGQCLLNTSREEFDVLGATLLKKNMQKQINTVQNKDTPPGKLISVEDQDDEEEDDDDENDEEEGQGVTIESAEETLETAWEVLETARVIYSKHPERKLQLADVYLCLGDLDMESDNMQEAVSDYSQCLKLREELLGRDNRNLADIHYSLGLALHYTNDVKNALIHFGSAKKILDSRLQKLMGSEKTEQLEAEIKDAKEIISELDLKIEELRQPSVPRKSLKEEGLSENTDGFGRPSVADAPIKNLGVFGRGTKQQQPNISQLSGSKRKSAEDSK